MDMRTGLSDQVVDQAFKSEVIKSAGYQCKVAKLIVAFATSWLPGLSQNTVPVFNS